MLAPYDTQKTKIRDSRILLQLVFRNAGLENLLSRGQFYSVTLCNSVWPLHEDFYL